jgi:RNA polymerase sigma-70 factor (ECF subfamily)
MARRGRPANPRAWLVSAGRFKAIDGIRRDSRFAAVEDFESFAETIPAEPRPSARRSRTTGCGSSSPAATRRSRRMRRSRSRCARCAGCAPRRSRTRSSRPRPRSRSASCAPRNKIRDAAIPYEVPEGPQLDERLDGVLRTIYLVFNEGYSASSGEELTRADLCLEAIRLGRLLVALLPQPEAMGLLALMLLQESRRTARATSAGDVITLEEQDRSRWNRELIAEGVALVEQALGSRRFGLYAIQAAIAAVHAEAPRLRKRTGTRSWGCTTRSSPWIRRPSSS